MSLLFASQKLFTRHLSHPLLGADSRSIAEPGALPTSHVHEPLTGSMSSAVHTLSQVCRGALVQSRQQCARGPKVCLNADEPVTKARLT